uniref:D-serine ammonia-lyase n=1 Tax=Caballeronia sp. LjRoot34 TaxID=3342325 RepID=UPI003F50C5A0
MSFAPALSLASPHAPQLWLNPAYGEPSAGTGWASIAQAKMAERRLAACAPLLARLFPELGPSEGIIESPLLEAPVLGAALHAQGGRGSYWVKADHALPVAGSIKARGGFHEVLEFAEALSLRHGLLKGADDDRIVLASDEARALFAGYEVAVGSTGNLGLSIGLIAAALGFRATVHMSADAKAWKKARLRANGVRVVEHDGDYGEAVQAGRHQALNDERVYFVDDEQSGSLFYGYSVAAFRLHAQFEAADCAIDARHPLFVYLPCGVGGAPAGIAYGLKAMYGDAVHCFFVEPQASACFLTRMANPGRAGITIYDAGMDNHTDADGLAVPRASELAVSVMRPLLSGMMTGTDDTFFADLYRARRDAGLRLEPSAAAGFSGPRMLFAEAEGRAYLAHHRLADVMDDARHLVWTTGGLLVPEDEYAGFLERGKQAAAVDDHTR